MPRCSRLLALVLAAALGAAAGHAQTISPAGAASSLDAATWNVEGSDSTEPGAAARAFVLGAPYPNPFTETATLTYTLDRPGPVRLELFDALGRRVAVIEDEERPAGTYRVRFNGDALPPGLYVVRLTSGDRVATRRLVHGN